MTQKQKQTLETVRLEIGLLLGDAHFAEACRLAIAYHLSFRKSKKPKNESELYKSLVKIWLEEVHPGWTFRAIDGAALNGIIERMRRYAGNPKNQLMVEINNEYLQNFFRHFCKKLPEFYKNQTLTVLLSKFDPIIEEIKTQNQKKIEKPKSMFSKFA